MSTNLTSFLLKINLNFQSDKQGFVEIMNFIGVSILHIAHLKVLQQNSSVHCRLTLWHMKDTFHREHKRYNVTQYKYI